MDRQSQLAPSINLLDVLRGIGRHKLLVSSVTLLALAGSLGYVTITKPLYATEAQILIENLSSPFDRPQSADDPRTEVIDDRVIQSQMSVLRSRDLAVRVIDALKLQERNEFDPLKNGEVDSKQKILLSLGFGEDPRLMTTNNAP
jgi:polysaccharide biosynthesis transport protein